MNSIFFTKCCVWFYPGDPISKPTSLKVQVDMPLLRQKTEAKMSLKSVVKTEDNTDKFHLPPDIVSRIYNQLHDSSQVRYGFSVHAGKDQISLRFHR